MGSFAVWGPSRSDLDRLAWSVAAAVDENFLWIEMTEGNAPPGSRELEVFEEIGLERIYRMDRAELLVPAGPVGSRGSATAGGEAGARLPHRLSLHLDRHGLGSEPRALVLANLDRVLELVPVGSELLPMLVAGSRRRNLSLITTFGVETSPALDSFDCLVHVRAGPEGNIWNPTVDWTSRSDEVDSSVPPPPGPAPTHREVVRHLRSQRANPA
jgi:hypothetical protein